MRNLEVGQYWHNLKNNKELFVSASSIEGHYVCKVTKYDISQTEIKTKYHLEYGDVINLGYVLGRHPDNIEQWQPKEGDLVWVKGRKNQGNIFHSPTKGKIVELEGSLYAAWKPSKHSTTLANEPLLFLELEPYADQDKKIDLSVAGQWVKCGDNIIKVTVNEDSNSFWGEHLGGWDSYKFRKDLNWQLLTPEQMKPLLDAYNAITESQND